MAPEAGRHFLPGDCASARPEEDRTVTESEFIKRTLPWGIVAAVIVACLLAVGGWVFAQDKSVAPAAPAAPAAAPAPPPSKPDPAGTATGGIADVTAKEAGKPTLAEG